MAHRTCFKCCTAASEAWSCFGQLSSSLKGFKQLFSTWRKRCRCLYFMMWNKLSWLHTCPAGTGQLYHPIGHYIYIFTLLLTLVSPPSPVKKTWIISCSSVHFLQQLIGNFISGALLLKSAAAGSRALNWNRLKSLIDLGDISDLADESLWVCCSQRVFSLHPPIQFNPGH